MLTLLAVLAGGLGAAARYAVDAVVRARVRATVPLGTLVVNAGGCLALGVVTGLVGRGAVPGDLAPVLGSGFLGGYTTFSTASLETVRLLREHRRRAALLHAVAMVGTGLGAAALGLAVAVPVADTLTTAVAVAIGTVCAVPGR